MAIGSFLGRARVNIMNNHAHKNFVEYFDAFQSSTMSRLHFLKLFMFFLILLTMYPNLTLSFLKLVRILNDGDVENNPGPTYKILKVVQGSFHQANIRFGETVGRQWCMQYFIFNFIFKLWSCGRAVKALFS